MTTAASSRQRSTSLPSIDPPRIELNAQEARVLGLIDDVTKHLKQTRSDLPAIECRVAGGWVRDKVSSTKSWTICVILTQQPQLLGKQCEDLDICTSSVTGFQFAGLVEEYLRKHRPNSGDDTHNGTSDDDAALKTSRIAKIVANPEQSKHLETARMTLLGMEIDFVQLRSEEYADTGAKNGSRIPTAIVREMVRMMRRLLLTFAIVDQKFGTPLEDAERRDLTINALFYNIHTQRVEDHLNKAGREPCIRLPLTVCTY